MTDAEYKRILELQALAGRAWAISTGLCAILAALKVKPLPANLAWGDDTFAAKDLSEELSDKLALLACELDPSEITAASERVAVPA